MSAAAADEAVDLIEQLSEEIIVAGPGIVQIKPGTSPTYDNWFHIARHEEAESPSAHDAHPCVE